MNNTVRKLTIIFLAGSCFFHFNSQASAERIHDRIVRENSQITAVHDNNIKNRINNILFSDKKNDNEDLKINEKIFFSPINLDDEAILGKPMATQQQCVKHLLRVNPAPNISVSPETLVSYYYQEGAREGIRPDVAFAQALKETGYFRYGGDVVPEQNNYCGLGTTGGGVRGVYFQSPRLGVRAHIQHLLAYASTREPKESLVDPRFNIVRNRYGGATFDTWRDLNGRWAVPGYHYGQSIMWLFAEILKEP